MQYPIIIEPIKNETISLDTEQITQESLSIAFCREPIRF